MTPEESGQLCLLSCILGENRDIFFPKLRNSLQLTTFSEIAVRYLFQLGYEAVQCASEEEARSRALELIVQKKWPCYFFKSDTTGEKDFEEFFTDHEVLDFESFQGIGVVKNSPIFDHEKLDYFMQTIKSIRSELTWQKQELVDLFNFMIPEFKHYETGKYLDQRM